MDQGPVIGRVLAALGSLDAPVTCTLGRVTIPTLEVPHNVSVVDWMDPFDVLARTQLVVTHAGMGTTLAALAHGVPMLALPMGRDQDGNAERIAQLGAGLALPPTSEVPDIRAATQRILDDPAFASAAHGVATEIAALDNGRSAVETVASLK
jgi:UDP:flavonoid glycosyltransferase YjiC (YdhE family)